MEVDEAARIITWAMAILMLTSHIDIIVSTSGALVFETKFFFASLVTHLNSNKFENSEYRYAS